MRLRGIFLGCVCLGIVLFFAACTEEETGTLHEVYKYPRELWGEWIRMDTGENWYIASNYMTKDIYSYSDDYKMEKQSANVIKVTGKASVFYLYASRTPNGSFNGSIMSLDNATLSALKSRAAGQGLGSINITVSNINDKKNEVETTTKPDGTFEVDGVIPGDGYEITGDGFSIPVYPNNSGEDVGTVTVTDGVNLMTSISPYSSYYYSSSTIDMMRLYTGTKYSLRIVIENIGTADSGAAQYTLTVPAGLTIVEGSTSGMLGTIEPGKTREIPIDVQCDAITGEYDYKKIAIQTKDARGKTWEDSVSLKFNKEYVRFNVVSEGEISGVVIVPNVKSYHFETKSTYDSTVQKYFFTSNIQVPKYKSDYLIVFSGATAASESKFSFAVDKDAEKDFNKNFNWGQYVNNTTETNAALVPSNADITYYLAKNDIIYYKVSF